MRRTMGTYLVEEIVNKRYRRGKAQYLIKWIGYGHHDNSWEPMEHLVGSEIPALIAEFENKRMDKVSAASKQPKLPVATSSMSRKHADPTQTQPPRKKSATATATSNNSSSSSIEEDAGGANDITEPLVEEATVAVPSPEATQPPRKKSATATATSNNSSSSSIGENSGGANDITEPLVEEASVAANLSPEADSEPEPEAIVGTYDIGKGLVFQIKWKNRDECSFVPLNVARVKWTQMVLKYFESRLKFCNRMYM